MTGIYEVKDLPLSAAAPGDVRLMTAAARAVIGCRWSADAVRDLFAALPPTLTTGRVTFLTTVANALGSLFGPPSVWNEPSQRRFASALLQRHTTMTTLVHYLPDAALAALVQAARRERPEDSSLCSAVLRSAHASQETTLAALTLVPAARYPWMHNVYLGSPHCPTDLLREALDGDDLDRRIGAAKNPTLAESDMLLLIADRRARVRAEVAGHPAITPTVADRLALDRKSLVVGRLLHNPATPLTAAEATVRTAWARAGGEAAKVPGTIRAGGRWYLGRLTPQQVQEGPFVLVAAAFGLKPSVVEACLADERVEVRHAAVQHRRVAPTRLRDLMTADPDEAVRQAAAASLFAHL